MSRSLLAVSLLLAFATPATASTVEPGEWEQVVSIDAAEGGPHGAMKRTVRSCITSADATALGDKQRWADEMVRANPQAECKVKETKQEGNAITAVLTCANDVVLTVRQDFQGTSGTIVAETAVGGVSQGKNKIESKRISETCSPESIEQWKSQNPGKTFAP
jgi:hypothetical protein